MLTITHGVETSTNVTDSPEILIRECIQRDAPNTNFAEIGSVSLRIDFLYILSPSPPTGQMDFHKR